jgi:hypothetical protein
VFDAPGGVYATLGWLMTVSYGAKIAKHGLFHVAIACRIYFAMRDVHKEPLGVIQVCAGGASPCASTPSPCFSMSAGCGVAATCFTEMF